MSLPDEHEDVLAYMRAHVETDIERGWRERAEAAEGQLEELDELLEQARADSTQLPKLSTARLRMRARTGEVARARLTRELAQQREENTRLKERDELMTRRAAELELRAARAERERDLVVRAQESAQRRRAAKKAGQASLDVGAMP